MAVLGVSTTSCFARHRGGGRSGGGDDRRGAPAIVVCQPPEEKVKRVASSIFIFTRSRREWKCFFSFEKGIFFCLMRNNQAKRETLWPVGSWRERERKDESADGSELFTLEFKFSGMQENTVWHIYSQQRHICIFSRRLELPLFRFVCYFIHCCFDGGGDVKLHTASKKKSISGWKKKLDLCKSDLGKKSQKVFEFGFEPTKLFNAHATECCRRFCWNSVDRKNKENFL